jgi:hypothetical protein
MRILHRLLGGFLLAGVGFVIMGSAGCSTSRANCQTVKLQRESGRSDSEIATALGLSESEIAKCGASGSSSAEAPSAEPSSGGGGGGAKPPM